MSSPSIPPIPYQTPLADNTGKLSFVWAKWMQQLYLRVGGANAPSNSDISGLQSQITALQNDITSLNTSIASLTTSIATLNTSVANLQTSVSGLKVGRVL